jgi:hypothetical protein
MLHEIAEFALKSLDLSIHLSFMYVCVCIAVSAISAPGRTLQPCALETQQPESGTLAPGPQNSAGRVNLIVGTWGYPSFPAIAQCVCSLPGRNG